MNAPGLHPFAPPPEQAGALALRRFGSGAPLVLIHGGVGSWTHWIANVEALARSFCVTAVDLPGYGDAPDAPSQDPELYLDAVADGLREALPANQPFGLVGFSFGAVVSAALTGLLEGRVGRLSLLGPGGFGVPVGRRVELLQVPDPESDPEGHRSAVAHNLGQFMLSRIPAPDDRVVDLQSANIARLRFDSRKISLQHRLLADLAGFSGPLQVIWGGEDRLAHPSIAERARLVAQIRPDAEIHVVPDAGHWVQFEAPRAVEGLLTDFHNG